MRIAEIYRSIQGEGLLSGTSSIFVRASGCNLRCWFCDTPFTSWRASGDDLAVDEIVRKVDAFGGSHVVLTGGEPMLFAELIPLCQRLHQSGYHLTVETAGTLYLPLECDLMSISPKLANSVPSVGKAGAWRQRHDQTRDAPEVIRRLITEYDYQFKFVIDRPQDCDEVEQYLVRYPEIERKRVMLMPQGTDVFGLAEVAQWLAPRCDEIGLAYCPRLHIEQFGFVRGT